jgi:hypothetical protein
MVDKAWFPRDATHGNSWYGSRVLQQMAGIVGATGSAQFEASTLSAEA